MMPPGPYRWGGYLCHLETLRLPGFGLQPGTVLMSVVPVTTENSAETWVLVGKKPCRSEYPVQQPVTVVTTGPRLQFEAVSVTVLQPWSGLILTVKHMLKT